MKESLQRPTPVPERGTLGALRRAAEGCRNCPLWQHATQTVFGAGSSKAKLMIVGEQPGDREDLAGQPFVGAAGKLLERAFEEAGIERSKVWLTNAVKHFKWLPRGKVRLHQKPSAGEIDACKPWLLGELQRVSPEVLILLGGTAARSLLGPGVKVMASRGVVEAPLLAPRVVLTVHPSSLLRLRDSRERDEAYRAFVNDLTKAVR
jgi:uracil-DNA glycosylase family protein